MAREKPLDFVVMQAWLAAWNESDGFSDASVRHLGVVIAEDDPMRRERVCCDSF
jgi:hypothetical protein